MLIDEGVNRGNFDSSGLSNGYRIGVLMADIEAEILQLTRAIFQSYPNKPLAEAQDWQATMLARYNELKQKVIGIFKTHQPEILYKANLSLANGFNVGVKEALDQLNVKPERQTYSLEKSEKGQEIVGQLNGNLLKAEAEVLNDIGLKFVETVAVVAAGGILGGSLYQAIDRVFLPKIEKGLTSKITSNGKRMSITEYSEGLVRENSQTALLAGQGEVAKASGNYYVRISAHASSCPKCTPYQDQILIDDVFAGGTPEPGIELLSAAMANGLFHWNCRHTKTIWIPGFSKRIPPPPDYDPEKVAMNYTIEQKQRAYERAIREAKRYEMGALTADQKIYGQRKSRDLQAELNRLIKMAREKGFAVYRQNWKEQIGFEYRKFRPYNIESMPTNSNNTNSSKENKGFLFVPANNKKEAEKFAKEVLGIKNVDYGNNDIVTINEWNKGLAEAFSRMPELKERFNFVGDCRKRNAVLKEEAHEDFLNYYKKLYSGKLTNNIIDYYAKADANSFIRRVANVTSDTLAQSCPDMRNRITGNTYSSAKGITINSSFGKNSSAFINILKRDVESKFHPIGCDTIKSVLDHEIGHQIDNLLKISSNSEIKALFNSMTRNELTQELSRYAWNNDNPNRYSEFVAEAWAEYVNNPNPRPIAQKVGQIIERSYEEWKRQNLNKK